MRKVYAPALKLFDNFEAVFFDHRIGENLFGDALELFLRLITIPAIEIQDKKFSLANIFHLRIAQSRQGVVNGLPLRIQHGALRHYPNMCFHANSITLSHRGLRRPPVQPATNPVSNATGLQLCDWRRGNLFFSSSGRKECSNPCATSLANSFSVRPIS